MPSRSTFFARNPRRSPARRLTTTLAAGLLLVLAGCGSDATPEAQAQEKPLREVSVILDWTPNTNHSGLYLAAAKGYYAQAGLKVDLIEPGDTSGLQLLAAGQADFALSVAESLVPARVKGIPVVSVAAVVEHNTSSLVSLADKNITRPRDLVGHTYGGYEGALEEALIKSLVRCDGGDPEKVIFIPLAGDDFRIGLTENYYDTAWIFNAWDGIRLKDIDKLDINTINFLDHTDCIPDWYTPLIAAGENTVTQDPELVRSFLAATARGYAEAMTDPAAAVDALMAAAPELDRDLLTRSADYLSTRYSETPAIWGLQSADTWSKFATFLKAHDLAPADFDVAAAWNGSFLPAAG
ncbi:ABC transporter substrate-binding protein [Nakamurella silvestris]|nr:ABC transporter substrate-binding protein [Nakamurella silvestris]